MRALAVQRLDAANSSCSPVGPEQSMVWSSSSPGREGIGQQPCRDRKSLVTHPLRCVWHVWFDQSLPALQVPPRAEEITIPADVTPEKVPTHIVDYSGRVLSVLAPCWPCFSCPLPGRGVPGGTW